MAESTCPDTLSATRHDRRARSRSRALLVVLCAGMFLVLLDVTAVNVALPAIGEALHTGVAGQQWVVDGYAVAIAGLLLTAGAVGDRVGHRRLVLIGFAVFAASSAICALAPTLPVLVGARALQGVGAALLLPGTMALIAHAHPDPSARARALGTWAAVSSLALPAGPIIAGALVSSSSWRLVFALNVPITLAILVVLPRLVGRDASAGHHAIDVAGGLGLTLTLCSALWVVIELGHHAAPHRVLPAVVVLVVSLGGTAYLERRRARHPDAPEPVLPLSLLRRPTFAAPNAVAFTMNLILNGTLFVTTLYLQQVRGLSAAVAGLAILPMALPLVVLAPVSGRLTARWGPRPAVLSGCGLGVVGGLLMLVVHLDQPAGRILLPILVTGLAGGLITASVVAATVQAAPPDRAGLATGMSNTARQFGTASGVAVFGALAGSPALGPAFTERLRLLGVGAAVLWLAALTLALRLPGRP